MFDIHQSIGDEHGDFDEARVRAYIDGLEAEFARSPEADALRAVASGDLCWAAAMIEYAISYVGPTPPEMTPRDLNEVLFDLFPRKVSVEPGEAAHIVDELRAFWAFVARQYGTPNAPQMLAALDDRAADRLRAELANPANFGMAKSFVTLGAEAGFDMTTPEGLASFQAAYNARLQAGRGGSPGWPAGEPGQMLSLPAAGRSSGEALKKKRKEKKRQRDAKKRNRK
jgi:hypothetical protein